MSSSNKTSLGLNLWSGTDTPKREDLNEDNRIINSGLSNRNILHNWYFKNPVNQRGIAGLASTPGYFIDRWKLISGTVTLTSNGLTLNGTIIQVIEYPVGTNVVSSLKTYSGTANASYENATKTYAITSTGGTIESAKLEYGVISTLVNDPPQDYGVELSIAQRYQLIFSLYSRFRATGYTASTITFDIPLPATMRILPATPVNPIVRSLTGTEQSDFTFVVNAPRPNCIIIVATKATHGLTDAQIDLPVGFIFDANI